MEKKERLKIGVIGTGHMGQNHVRILSEEIGRFDLLGVYDQNRECAKSIAEQYGTKAYDELGKLLKDVSAVIVAVPSSLHREIGVLVAENNVHAMIEKPIALNSEDALIIDNVFRKRRLKLQVGHIERYNPVIKELKKLLTNRRPFYLEIHRYSPFGGSGRITDTSVIEDLMIHDIDLSCYLMHPLTIKDIRANGESIRSDDIDFATCMMDFEDRSGNSRGHAVINASRVSQSKERSISVHTDDSFIYANLLTRQLTITQNTDVVVNIAGDNSYRQDGTVQNIFVPMQEPLRQELLAFYDAIMFDKEIEVSGKVASSAIRICEDVNRRIASVKER